MASHAGPGERSLKPPPQTVEGGFVDGHVFHAPAIDTFNIQRRINKSIPGVVSVFEFAVEGERMRQDLVAVLNTFRPTALASPPSVLGIAIKCT